MGETLIYTVYVCAYGRPYTRDRRPITVSWTDLHDHRRCAGERAHNGAQGCSKEGPDAAQQRTFTRPSGESQLSL
eukprot:38859-Eustigmatos_ZCMA.PRE.1